MIDRLYCVGTAKFSQKRQESRAFLLVYNVSVGGRGFPCVILLLHSQIYKVVIVITIKKNIYIPISPLQRVYDEVDLSESPF